MNITTTTTRLEHERLMAAGEIYAVSQPRLVGWRWEIDLNDGWGLAFESRAEALKWIAKRPPPTGGDAA